MKNAIETITPRAIPTTINRLFMKFMRLFLNKNEMTSGTNLEQGFKVKLIKF